MKNNIQESIQSQIQLATGRASYDAAPPSSRQQAINFASNAALPGMMGYQMFANSREAKKTAAAAAAAAEAAKTGKSIPVPLPPKFPRLKMGGKIGLAAAAAALLYYGYANSEE